jgi:hypothetical protein
MDSPKLKTISHDFLLDKMRVFYSRYQRSGNKKAEPFLTLPRIKFGDTRIAQKSTLAAPEITK